MNLPLPSLIVNIPSFLCPVYTLSVKDLASVGASLSFAVVNGVFKYTMVFPLGPSLPFKT